jgi:hypothetical protein
VDTYSTADRKASGIHPEAFLLYHVRICLGGYLLTQEKNPMAPLTFRNSRIVYYGPHACENCGVDIAKMGSDWGGTSFTYPSGPIYPNTEWHPHVCDPALVKAYKLEVSDKKQKIQEKFPDANAFPLDFGIDLRGFIILGEKRKDTDGHLVSMHDVISGIGSFDNENEAWIKTYENVESKEMKIHRTDIIRRGMRLRSA